MKDGDRPTCCEMGRWKLAWYSGGRDQHVKMRGYMMQTAGSLDFPRGVYFEPFAFCPYCGKKFPDEVKP